MMKKLTLKNKLVACGMLGILSLGLLLGAGKTQEVPLSPVVENKSFATISNEALRFSLMVFPENNSATNPSYSVALEQGDPHFAEILNIVSAYDFEDVDLSHKERNRESISFDNTKPHRQISFTVYSDIVTRQGEEDWAYLNYDPQKTTVLDFLLNEMGEINVNAYLYHMGDEGALLVDEIFEYLEQNPEIERTYSIYAQ